MFAKFAFTTHRRLLLPQEQADEDDTSEDDSEDDSEDADDGLEEGELRE